MPDLNFAPSHSFYLEVLSCLTPNPLATYLPVVSVLKIGSLYPQTSIELSPYLLILALSRYQEH